MSKTPPSDWKVMRFSDMARLEYGRSLPVKHRKPGLYPVVGSAGIIDYHNEAYLDQPGIVVGRKGSIGTVSWLQEKSFPIDTTYYVDTDRKLVDYKWLFYFLSNQNLPRLNRATGVPGLNRDDVYALQVLLPPLDEQKKIANILGSVDDATEQTENVITNTEQLRDALLHELLTRGLPGHHTEWKKVPGLGTIPTTWRVARVIDIAVPKGTVSGPFGSNISQKFYVSDGVPVIRGNNIFLGTSSKRFVDAGFVFITEEKAQELLNSECKPGDLIFTARGTIGQVGLIPPDTLYSKYILSANQLRLRGDASIVNNLYLYYYFSSRTICQKILQRATSTGVPNFNLGALRSLPVILPPITEQNEIAKILVEIDDALEPIENLKLALEQTKSSLSDKLLSGNLSDNGYKDWVQ